MATQRKKAVCVNVFCKLDAETFNYKLLAFTF